MSEHVAIRISNVVKDFKLPHEKHTGIKQAALNFTFGGTKYEVQHALNEISFEIKQGEFFGIVGRNGSGKSTLLKILAGIYQPTKGTIEVDGRLVPFIELGVGFNPELTGRENVYLNAALLGFSTKQTDAMYAEIVEFAELEEFMDQKLKNYSSGMQVRLAFSIAIRAEAEILLIDEVLAVGDENFQKKCLEVFDRLKREGRTIVFVTHSMSYVREFCDRVAVIDRGDLVYVGETEKGVDIYNKLNFQDETTRLDIQNKESKDQIERFGNGKAQIRTYAFYDRHGKETTVLSSGQKFKVTMEIDFLDKVSNPSVGIMFRKNPQENLFGINNFYSKQHFGTQVGGDNLIVTAYGMLPLAPGSYFVSFSVSDAHSEVTYTELDNLNNVLRINVDGEQCWGMVATEMFIEAHQQ